MQGKGAKQVSKLPVYKLVIWAFQIYWQTRGSLKKPYAINKLTWCDIMNVTHTFRSGILAMHDVFMERNFYSIENIFLVSLELKKHVEKLR